MRIERFEDIEMVLDLRSNRKNDHAGCTFALLRESDRVRCHSGFHPAIRLPGQPTSVIKGRKITLNGELDPAELVAGRTC